MSSQKSFNLEWPYPKGVAFISKHRAARTLLLEYTTTGRGRQNWGADQVARSQSRLAARLGIASSAAVRMALMNSLEANGFDKLLPEEGGCLTLCTFVPAEFGFWDIDYGRFEPALLRKLVKGCLAGHNYIAVIEPAIFDHWLPFSRRPNSRHLICWHVHALVTTPDFDALKLQIRNGLQDHRGFVSGKPPYHMKRVQTDHLAQWMRYITKLPRSAYRVRELSPIGSPIADRKFKLYKRSIPPIRAFEAARELSHFKIGELVFGGGIGAEIKTAAFRKARQIVKSRAFWANQCRIG